MLKHVICGKEKKMELIEPVENINKRLKDLFGIDSVTGQVMWRIVWSDDQFEKRLMDVTDEGFDLLVPEVREVKKYKGYTSERFILERLVLVPEYQQAELAGAKISYEPMWTFEDGDGNYLPPKFEACEFVITTVLKVQHGPKGLKRYVDPEATEEGYLLEKKKRVDSIVEELFGDQSGLDGSTVTGESIIVPSNFEKVN